MENMEIRNLARNEEITEAEQSLGPTVSLLLLLKAVDELHN